MWSGVSMMTSCAPIPFMRSNMPSAWRFSVPSIPKAGNLLGTTRTVHPGVSRWGWWSAVRVRTIGLNLGRRLGLVPVAEGAESPLDLHIFADKIGWALGPVGRNNHPAANNRIFSQLRQLPNPFSAVTQTSYFTPTRKRCEILRSAGGNRDTHSIRLQYRISIGRGEGSPVFPATSATSRRLCRSTAASASSRRARSCLNFNETKNITSQPISRSPRHAANENSRDDAYPSFRR